MPAPKLVDWYPLEKSMSRWPASGRPGSRPSARFGTVRPITHQDPRPGYPAHVLFFFSNRLGCLGSLLISAVLTAILLLIFL